jgi:hypothetical protein
MTAASAQITVIYPLYDLRGDPVFPVRAWTQEQTLPRDRYRVILAFDEADHAKAAELEPLLGPDDELLTVPGGDYGTLLRAAAARVRTPWLVLTEGHCIPKPGCLDAVMRWIEASPDAEIGNFELVHLRKTIVTSLIARWYDDMLAQWRAATTWPRLLSAGCAIRTDLMNEEGGLQTSFSAFSLFAQSACLSERRVKVASIPDAVVIHLDEPTMADFHQSTELFIRGEFAARTELDPVFMERYFGHASYWHNRLRLQRRTALTMARAVLAAAWAHPRRSARLAGVFASLVAEAAAGLRLRVALKRAAMALDDFAIEWLPMPNEWRWSRFMRVHGRSARVAQLEWVRRHPTPAAPGLSHGRWPVEQVGAHQLIGVHGLEQSGGRGFRWTEPVAMVRLARRDTDCTIHIETGRIRGNPLEALIAIVVGGRVLPRELITSDEEGTITVRLPAPWAAAASDGIVLISAPLSPARAGSPDDRLLGLPISSVAVAA